MARPSRSSTSTHSLNGRPSWCPASSTITSVADLAGKHIAATIGTDPYFFLLQALEEAGVPLDSVTVENLQHADGWAALQNGVGRRLGGP